ncbi:MAG TPA: phosphate ABC transporter ATP-binding protein [Planctomycetota bacterium]|nr:phosphate ABC transporter ATP-binding protein [Planctomycetota bacterium]HRR79558.1 phosphate ABC transporter ATP-binding protein [Planctomycetota bacterium]HRT94401.1 phosphate ABC transporter ATP-binding protein [Planctomycetota bacterium]
MATGPHAEEPQGADWLMRAAPAPAGPAVVAGTTPKVVVEGFTALFQGCAVLRNLSLQLFPRERLAIIGPAGSGKTTFLRSLNRLNDLEAGFSKTGRILLDGQDIYAPGADVVALRRRVGMVYAVPVPLPWSIRDNLTYGPRLAGTRDRARLDQLVEESLKNAFLWDEVKDRLGTSAMNLSGGQQQRLCLARALTLEPEVLLLDEPCSGLDPISTAKIEDALAALRAKYSIILVTNNTKQAARASDRTAFLLMGELIEIGPTEQIFTNPAHHRTAGYITGRFG